ncbi:MAG: exosortase, partial [Acetobacteraceae bacterium]|nr:exosortase [Acetobacteraceae bacterium]
MTAVPLELRPDSGAGAQAAPAPAGMAASPAGPAASWAPALAVLGLGLAVMFGIVFREETLAAVTVWDASTAYNHCWLVLPVAIWLGWTRRDRLRGLAPAPLPLAALLGLAPALAWFAAERLGIMEGRQLAVMGLTWVLFLAVLGWPVFRALAAPLAYLVFLVPFGEFVTPALQDITAWMIDVLLDIWGIPHFVDHLIIEIPAGTFLVAEACAGLRFLIAAIAFGALYALVMFRSPGRRLVVMVLAVVVPIIANGIRAFGIVVVGHTLGNAEAAAADHVIYGWVFFSIVILLLILVGLPFREDLDDAARAGGHAPAAAPGGARGR